MRILIADDNVLVRSGIADLLRDNGWEVCGEASNVVMNGLDAAPELRRIAPKTPIILYTAFADAISTSNLKAEGVTLVLPKSESLETLVARAEGLFRA